MLNNNEDNFHAVQLKMQDLKIKMPTNSKEDKQLQVALHNEGLNFINVSELRRKNHPGGVFDKRVIDSLGKQRTRTPDMGCSELSDHFLISSKYHGFIVGDTDASPMTPKERNLVILLIGTSPTIYQENYGIPPGAKGISFVHKGFVFGGSHCLDFKPTFYVDPESHGYMEFFKKTPRVQVATFVSDQGKMRRSAGICWWFGDDLDEHYNLHTIFEAQRKQLIDAIYDVRQAMRADPLVQSRSGMSFKELGTANIMKICMGPDRKEVVLMDHDLGIQTKKVLKLPPVHF